MHRVLARTAIALAVIMVALAATATGPAAERHRSDGESRTAEVQHDSMMCSGPRRRWPGCR